MSKRDLEVKSFGFIKLGISREIIKEEVCLEATYDKSYRNVKTKNLRDKRNNTDKKNIRVYGYKNPKVLKFIG